MGRPRILTDAERRAHNAARCRKYRLAHPKRCYAALARWRKRNPQKVNIYNNRTRARRRRAEGRHSHSDMMRIYAEQGGRCAYCAIALNGVFEGDHKHPLAKGGSDFPDNMACACRPCNRAKRSMTEAEFRIRLGRTT